MIFTPKKLFFLLLVFSIAVFSSNLLLSPARAAALDFDVRQKHVILSDGGFSFDVVSNASTVGDFLKEQDIALNPNDMTLPDGKDKIYSGSHMMIWRAKKITIKEGGKTNQTYTLSNTVQEAIWENKDINLAEDDITNPARQTLLQDGITIAVTHVIIKEETKQLPIDYKTISNEDDSLSWRVKKITQKGEKGVSEIKYKVMYYDGPASTRGDASSTRGWKEISRKVLEKNTTKDPVSEVVTQGTLVKVGKAARGDGTWYAFKGGLFAASRTIPRGGYAKVTNMDNGKSVIVQINDYGPQAPQRIIDLDKVAFAKIANLGEGVLHNVKVEQILN